MNKLARKILAAYGIMTVIAIIYVVLNLFCNFLIKNNSTPQIIQQFGLSRLATLYPDMNEEQVNELLHETWNIGMEYHPFVQFSEPSFNGKYVNITKGYRKSIVDGDEFAFFGGSTTFGYGLPDHQTIPSYFSLILNQHSTVTKLNGVKNFGRGFYFSSQERSLISDLLVKKQTKPKVAIFIDGLNDSFFHHGQPIFTQELKELMASKGSFYHLQKELINSLPLHRFLKSAFKSQPETVKSPNPPGVEMIKQVIDRYQRNISMIHTICKLHGTKALFVWQPVPSFNFNLEKHPLYPDLNIGPHMASKYVYESFQEKMNGLDPGLAFLDLSNLHSEFDGNHYIDTVHYSAPFSEKIAEAIFHHIESLGWLASPLSNGSEQE